jgi:hypothetical protein
VVEYFFIWKSLNKLLILLTLLFMPKHDPAKLKKVSISLPFGIGSAEWEADTTERKAAWSLYVELVTRIAVQSLEVDQGLVREALNSVGGIAIAVLNNGLRPFLAKWHPVLQAWEARRPLGVSPKEHEVSWSEESKLRSELAALRDGLEQYAKALATIAGVEE